MPAPQQAFNIGRDATLNIVVAGSPLKPTVLTKFRFSQESIQLKSRPLGGPPIFQEVPDGWKGEFEVDRADATLESYFAKFESGFYSGADATTITILITVFDAAVGATGPTHQFRLDGLVLKFEDAGEYAGDTKVVQKVSFTASTLTQVS